MSRTTNLRRQHDAAVALVGQIGAMIEGYAGDTDAYRIAVQLAKLSGLLRIHFAQEDRTLYPYMITSANDDAAAVARDFQDEMGDLGAHYEAYAKRWSNSAAIVAGFERFKAESRAVFGALGERIQRENAELYPLADAIQPDEVRRTA